MIVGFVGCGDVSNVPLALERSKNGDADHTVPKHMLVFMMCGIYIHLQFSYAQYPHGRYVVEIVKKMCRDHKNFDYN